MTMKDLATKKLMFAQSRIKKFSKVAKADIVSLAAGIYLVEKAFKTLAAAVNKTVVPLVQTASKIEDLKVRLNVLFKSAKIGNQVFKDMAELAGNVPKTYDEIMESATQLAGVVEGGADEINKLMPMIVDISAATGLSVQEATSQVIRMYSAGAAAADMFRERGISAALGFQAGVKYTNKETMDILYKQWEEGFGKYVGASELLKETFTGMTSMMQDAWFQFKQDIGGEMFDTIKLDLAAVLELIKDGKKEGGEYGKVVEDLGDFFDEAYESGKKFFTTILLGSARLVDAWNTVDLNIKGAYGALLLFSLKYNEINSAILNHPISLKSDEVKEKALQNVKLLKEEVLKLAGEVADAQLRANVDHYGAMEKRLENFENFLGLEKDAQNQHYEEEKEVATEHYGELGAIILVMQQQINDTKRQELQLTDKQKEKYKELLVVNKQIQKAFSSNLADIMTGTKSAKEAFESLGKSMVKMIASYVAEWIIAQTIGRALQAVAVKLAISEAKILEEAWKPAAVFAAIATAGGAAVAGVAGMVGAFLVATGLSKVKVPSMADGGIVPATPGGRIIRVAEAGQDEAVIPLGRAGIGKVGGGMVVHGDINIDVYVPTQSNDLTPEEIGQMVADEINEKLTRGRSFV